MLINFKRLAFLSFSSLLGVAQDLNFIGVTQIIAKWRKLLYFGLGGLHNIKYSFAEDELWGRQRWEAELCWEDPHSLINCVQVNLVISIFWAIILINYLFINSLFQIIEPRKLKFCLNWLATLFPLIYFLRINRFTKVGWFHSYSCQR